MKLATPASELKWRESTLIRLPLTLPVTLD
jgi:hypothetical protein